MCTAIMCNSSDHPGKKIPPPIPSSVRLLKAAGVMGSMIHDIGGGSVAVAVVATLAVMLSEPTVLNASRLMADARRSGTLPYTPVFSRTSCLRFVHMVK